MKAMGIILAILVFAVGGLGLWLYSAWDTATMRYRLTYVIEAAGETKTGSSIVQVRREDTTKLPLPNTGYGNRVTGEAVVVDLGGGKYLFSLLKESKRTRTDSTAAEWLPYTVFKDLGSEGMNPVEFTRMLADKKPSESLAHYQLPLLVTFTDINDPASVVRVDPDDLESHFGAGVKLKAVTLEITDEPVTNGRVEGVLGWWKEYREKHYRLNGKRSFAHPIKSKNFADLVGTGVFKIGGQ